MNNVEFLVKYIKLLGSLKFFKLINIDSTIIGYSEDDTSVYFNYALLTTPVKKEIISKLEKEFINLNRTSTIYFENNDYFIEIKKLIEQLNYKKSFEDSWLFYEGKIDTKNFNFVKIVENETELDIFLETADKCYQKEDPQNPYGELGGYKQILKKSWLLHNKNDSIAFFIVYDGNTPVAVSTLNNFEDIGYISNVGSLKEVRGKGFGKLATIYCVYHSQKKGNKIHCLATEKGTYPYEFYQRIGFKNMFTAIAYSKQ